MKTQEAINKSIDAGYNPMEDSGNIYKIFLDPQFWQCLGKAMGWDRATSLGNWHNLIEDIWYGKTIEKYFEDLK